MPSELLLNCAKYCLSRAFVEERGVSKSLLRERQSDPAAAGPGPEGADLVEVAPYREFTPAWGRRGTLWEWLVVIACATVFVVVFAKTTHERVERLGAAAFPQWHWDIYDLKVWPLKYFKGGAHVPSWRPW
jgi:hypothetical protein